MQIVHKLETRKELLAFLREGAQQYATRCVRIGETMISFADLLAQTEEEIRRGSTNRKATKNNSATK